MPADPLGRLRGYRPDHPDDRAQARALLSRLVGTGRVPFAIHPGDWDWWCFHHDPRVPVPLQLLGDHALVNLTRSGELCGFGLGPAELAELLRAADLPVAIEQVGYVSERDGERIAALRTAGLAPSGAPLLSFELPLHRLTGPGELPPGYVIRPLAPATATERSSRADAARLAFGSTMPPEQHRDRYRRFTESVAYPDCLDLVAVAPGGEIAAFTVLWPDAASRTVQLEPVGTHPAHLRCGLARAVILEGLRRMADSGLQLARVCTERDRPAAPELYRSCGFSVVDRLHWWHRRR